MNKEKMGLFLKSLRTERKLSQEKLSLEFEKEYLSVTISAISSWEKGITIPDIDKLNFLANFYNVAIDEILNGEKEDQVDFNQIYYLHDYNNPIYKNMWSNYTDDIFEIFHIEEERIKKRFKLLVNKYSKDEASMTEISELAFLFDNYFKLRNPYTTKSIMRYIQKLNRDGYNQDEIFWTVSKIANPIREIKYSFNNLIDDAIADKKNSRCIDLNIWEKDLYLMYIRGDTSEIFDRRKFHKEQIKEFEQRTSKPFNDEELCKCVIEYLASNGAMINDNYSGYSKKVEIEHSVLDELEEINNKYFAPIKIALYDDNSRNYIENNEVNRFVLSNLNEIVIPMEKLGYSVDKVLGLFKENEKCPESFIKDIEQHKKSSKDKFDRDAYYLDAIIRDWKKIRSNIVFDSSDIVTKRESLEEMLNNGKFTYIETSSEWVGGNDRSSIKNYVLEQNDSLSFKDFNKGRNKEKTNNLFKDLPNLSLKEIVQKYFVKEEK